MEHIKQHIEERLWNFIKRSHNSEDYKNAILDSIQFVGDIIREKSGLDNDGNQLVGIAFGGSNPKIKLNKLKTESERNVQKGIEQILRGIYTAYRNPRSHSKINDSEQDAAEIIVFINHLLKIIDKSKGKFSTENFLKRVFDDDFVQSKKYAELIVNDIPKNKIFEVTIEIFRLKETGKIHNLKLIWFSLFEKLNEEEKKEILVMVSEELRYSNSIKNVIRCIALFKPNWIEIDEDARLRAENKIIQQISDSEKYPQGDINDSGAHSSWISDIIKISLLRNKIAEKIYESLDSQNINKQRFILDYFRYNIFDLEDDLFLISFNDVFKKELSNGNRLIFDWISNYHDTEKISEFKKELDNFIEIRPEDDLPF